MTDYKTLTRYLLQLGTDKVDHTGNNYLAHCVGLYHFMKERGCSEELCQAGMYHSIYGTELFQRFSLPLEKRPEVRALIGERAEKLAYLNCVMLRESFDRILDQPTGPYRFLDRVTGQEVSLDREDYDDLARIHLYDWLEQVPRSRKWDYRRPAYRKMAERLGGIALETYDRVFALETKEK